MIRTLSFFSACVLFAVPVVADELGVPAGVLIYDADPAAPVIQAAPVTQAAPLIGAAPNAGGATFTLLPEPAPLIIQPTQSNASIRSSITQVPIGQPVPSGTILNPTVIAPQVPLAPGETVIQAIAAPPAIVRIPNPEPAYTVQYGSVLTRAAPPPKRDPVTGRLRDTPGWTGRRDKPASIGCFPAGACAVLNAR